jgi:ABC-type Fe3+-hydroxamate transport system substrate-binding protein
MKKLLVTLAIAASVVTGACASMGSRSISEVKTNPGKYADKTVTVEGVVTTSFGIPLVPYKVYRISDGTSEMLVISDNDRLPGKDARVRVRGEVEEVALIGGRSFGLHIREKSIKFL